MTALTTTEQEYLLNKEKDKEKQKKNKETTTTTVEIEIVKTTLKIPNHIIKELKHISIDDNKTLTEIIIEALVYYLKEKRGKKI